MNKIKKIKVVFKPIYTKETEAILEQVYDRLFSKAYKNIMTRRQKEIVN